MPAAVASEARSVSLFLGADAMTGQGIGQILANPVAPRLYEQFVTSALT